MILNDGKLKLEVQILAIWKIANLASNINFSNFRDYYSLG